MSFIFNIYDQGNIFVIDTVIVKWIQNQCLYFGINMVAM